jgi:NhaP-type Na+/H+ or K+/H+ antiporter
MGVLIFFGGLVMGFFLGWLCIALLTMATERNQEKLAYCRAVASEERDHLAS